MKRLFSALVLATSVSTAAADDGLEGFEVMTSAFAAADGCNLFVDTNLWGNGRYVDPKVTLTREVCGGVLKGYPVFDQKTARRLTKIKTKTQPVAVHGEFVIERAGPNFIVWSGKKGKWSTITPKLVKKALKVTEGTNPQLVYGNSVFFGVDTLPLVFRYRSTVTGEYVDTLISWGLKKKRMVGALQ